VRVTVEGATVGWEIVTTEGQVDGYVVGLLDGLSLGRLSRWFIERVLTPKSWD
jgi:hypothetical protein